MGFRIIDLDTDPSIRGCGYCDLERGGISDDTARSFAAARRAFWRAHDDLEKSRAEHDEALVHALTKDSTARVTRDLEADPDEHDGDEAKPVEKRGPASRRPSALPPRRMSGTGSASRRVRFRRA